MKIHKKVLMMCATIIVFGATLMFGTLLIDSSTYKRVAVVVNRIENTYDFYIKGDNLLKVSLKERFSTCKSADKIKKCSLISDDIISVINVDTRVELVEYREKEAIEVINKLINETNSKKITITTNWNNRFTGDEILDLIDNKEKEITINFKKDINEKELTTTTAKTYTVKFDTKGGSSIKEVQVKKNKKVKNPGKPTKKGYIFVEWQLNGKKYDFDSKVTKDITLVAKWKKKSA